MPQYHVGHMDHLNAIALRVATHQGLELAGYSYEGVGIPDSIRSAEAAAERMVESII